MGRPKKVNKSKEPIYQERKFVNGNLWALFDIYERYAQV